LETQKRTPWRRWIVLVLMIAGFILGGIFVPVQPEITVAAEKLIEKPIVENFLGLGPLYLVNTLPTLFFTIFIVILPLAWAIRNSLKKSAATDLIPRGIGNVAEAILEMLYNLAEGTAGKYVKWIFPWFATIMIYVLFANLLKLIPGFESIGVLHPAHGEGHAIAAIGGGWSNLLPAKVEEGGYILAPFFRGISVDLNFTASLAIIAVVWIQVIGFRAQGISSKCLSSARWIFWLVYLS
jgi:F-type H+-transporting ATPase subunit a